MNLTTYPLKDVFRTAIKSEIESEKIYSDLAKSVKNAFLKDKFNFLSGEEEKHKILLRSEFKKEFPEEELVIPDETLIPLPEIIVPGEDVPLSDIVKSAMDAELAAKEYYHSMKRLFDKHAEVLKTLDQFASMEDGHYKLLKIELENLEKFEDYDVYWEMMNIGP